MKRVGFLRCLLLFTGEENITQFGYMRSSKHLYCGTAPAYQRAMKRKHHQESLMSKAGPWDEGVRSLACVMKYKAILFLDLPYNVTERHFTIYI